MLRIFRPNASSCLHADQTSQTTASHKNGTELEHDEAEDIAVTVLRWLSDRVVLVSAPSTETAHWVLKFSHNKDPEDITSWNESALQRFLSSKEPEHIVPPAFDSDYVAALIGRQKSWRAVKATLYISEYLPRQRNEALSVQPKQQLNRKFAEVVCRIHQLLAQSPYATDKKDMDWACTKKNVIRPTAEAFLFHDFDHNVTKKQ